LTDVFFRCFMVCHFSNFKFRTAKVTIFPLQNKLNVVFPLNHKDRYLSPHLTTRFFSYFFQPLYRKTCDICNPIH
jgi:hypothetical protein